MRIGDKVRVKIDVVPASKVHNLRGQIGTVTSIGQNGILVWFKEYNREEWCKQEELVWLRLA